MRWIRASVEKVIYLSDPADDGHSAEGDAAGDEQEYDSGDQEPGRYRSCDTSQKRRVIVANREVGGQTASDQI